jgi:TIR domain
MAGEAVGFWSYVHADDEDDHGRILALAKDLESAYRLQTGERLNLFVDRDDVEWGVAWKERIDSAIAGTTFFIPIITPSYFKSPECRRELLKFTREAEALGLTELLTSVYWVRVPALQDAPEASPDEAIRLVAKYKWEPLRDERLEDRDSSLYRKSLSKLAEKLEDRARQAAEVEDIPTTTTVILDSPSISEIGSVEIQASHSEVDDGGVLDHLAGAEEAMPRVGDLLVELTKEIETVGELTENAGHGIDAAAQRGQGAKAALTVTNRLAHELAGPASAIASIGREYGQALAEVDLGIHAQLDLIEESGQPSRTDRETLREIQGLRTASGHGANGLNAMLEGMEPISKLSRSLRAPLGELRNGLLGVLDGNAVIEGWGKRATELLEDCEFGSDDEDPPEDAGPTS